MTAHPTLPTILNTHRKRKIQNQKTRLVRRSADTDTDTLSVLKIWANIGRTGCFARGDYLLKHTGVVFYRFPNLIMAYHI